MSDDVADAIREVLDKPLTERAAAIIAIATGLCRAHMRRDPDLPCLCDKVGRSCHAPVIYRNEAVSVLLALEAAGFTIKGEPEL